MRISPQAAAQAFTEPAPKRAKKCTCWEALRDACNSGAFTTPQEVVDSLQDAFFQDWCEKYEKLLQVAMRLIGHHQPSVSHP